MYYPAAMETPTEPAMMTATVTISVFLCHDLLGDFGGCFVSSVAIEYLSSRFRSLAIGDDGVVFVRGHRLVAVVSNGEQTSRKIVVRDPTSMAMITWLLRPERKRPQKHNR